MMSFQDVVGQRMNRILLIFCQDCERIAKPIMKVQMKFGGDVGDRDLLEDILSSSLLRMPLHRVNDQKHAAYHE